MTGALQFRWDGRPSGLNGGLGFRNGKADVVMLGTTFGLDTTRLIVDNGKILFRQYRFIAPNKSDMVLNGAITLTPFDRMNMDISVKAGNFRGRECKEKSDFADLWEGLYQSGFPFGRGLFRILSSFRKYQFGSTGPILPILCVVPDPNLWTVVPIWSVSYRSGIPP